MRLQQYLLIFPLLFVVWSCDVIESPYLEEDFVEQGNNDDPCIVASQADDAFPEGQTIEKMVLLEEMTGHLCGNCPRATEVAYSLYSQQFAGRVVFIGIHAGPLAGFTPGASKYSADYTTPEGSELYQEFNSVGAVPFGMIDRAETGYDARRWSDFVTERLAEAPTAGIRIFNCYNEDNTGFSTVVDVKMLAANATAPRLSVVLVEDDIVSWQKDYDSPNGSPDIPDYSHHYVLRGAINGTFGQPVSEEAVAVDDVFTLKYDHELTDDLNPSNCYVVAFVYDEATNAVGQVAIQSLVE